MPLTKRKPGEKRKDFMMRCMTDPTMRKEFKNTDMLYGIISSLREKINAPLRNRKNN